MIDLGGAEARFLEAAASLQADRGSGRNAPYVVALCRSAGDVPSLVSEVERLRGLLARLEWAPDYDGCKWCPGCERRYCAGSPEHAAGCWVVEAGAGKDGRQ